MSCSKHAQALLDSYLKETIAPLCTRMYCTPNTTERVILAQEKAPYSVAFRTTRRGDEFSLTLIQRILRLPNARGLFCNFQWAKTVKDGLTYDKQSLAILPVQAVEEYIQIGTAVGWNMTKGYLFPTITEESWGSKPHRRTSLLSATQITKYPRWHSAAENMRHYFSRPPFRSGGAISQALEGEILASMMQRALWKRPSTAWRYMQLIRSITSSSEL